MRPAKTIAFLALLAASFMSTDTWALPHANILPKDTLDAYSGRDYQEGSSATLSIAFGHGCTHSGESYSTRYVTALFPNGYDLDPDLGDVTNLGGVTYTAERNGTRPDVYDAGNAVFGIKPVVDSNWKEIQTLMGDVPGYYSHGGKSTDVRAIHWRWGYFPNNFRGNAKVRVNFPKFEESTCVNKIKVDIPVVQYCAYDPQHARDDMWKRDRMQGKNLDRTYAWIKDPTPNFPTPVGDNYVASLTIVRNESSNPLPDSCGGTGDTLEIYPSEADIDSYLLPAGGKKKWWRW